MEYDDFYIRSQIQIELNSATFSERMFLLTCLRTKRFVTGNLWLTVQTIAFAAFTVYLIAR